MLYYLHHLLGWSGFTAHSLKQTALFAGMAVIAANLWNVFTRLGDDGTHHEAVTSRPMIETRGKRFKTAAVAALSLATAAAVHAAPASDAAAGWKVGVARVNITPQKPIWMAGYGNRNHESEGVWQDIWAKALAFEDKDGHVGVIETLDICAIAGGLSNEIRDRLEREFGLKRDQIIINTSHTHSGPQMVGAYGKLPETYPYPVERILDAAYKLAE